MFKRHLWGLLGVFSLTQCDHPRPATHPRVHYIVGAAWKGIDAWFYPEERFSYRATGLAIKQVHPHGYVTSDGELWSKNDMTGAHQTLQLPSVVSVRNMSNGLTVRVRLNDRGPRTAGRLISLTPRAANLLKMGEGPIPVEIIEDEGLSKKIAESAPGSFRLGIARAPRGRIIAKSLDDGATHKIGTSFDTVDFKTSPLLLPRLDAVSEQSSVSAVAYYILYGDFNSYRASWQLASRCQAHVKRQRVSGKGLIWRVERGPFRGIAEADKALAGAQTCTGTGARIVIR